MLSMEEREQDVQDAELVRWMQFTLYMRRALPCPDGANPVAKLRKDQCATI